MPPLIKTRLEGRKMKRTYIISRYRAKTEKEVEFNRRVARHFCRKLIDYDSIPIAPHLYYTQFLDDSFPGDRECGLELAIRELRSSDEFLLIVIDGVISEGMRGEIEEVGRLGIPGRIVCLTHKEIEEAMKVVR